ncbi:membrane protein insertase YidC [Spiroplasma endosymbiont of Labia minor]|uniref:membrane protein insertase YidC n=1 Tax=Spiroplasma endosymbiont of Labia minor TaxID=3066305 RepID=UPI0030CC5FD4
MYKQDYGKYLTNKTNKPNPWTVVWKWTKIVIFLFMIMTLLWGCVQMYSSKYMISQITDMTGRKVYAPGVSFEIIISSLGEDGSKSHYFVTDGGSISEYSLFAITNWGEAWVKTASPFYGLFVYPLAFILVGFVRAFAGTLDPTAASYGAAVLGSIFITSILVRSVTLGASFKTQKNQDKMQELQQKQGEIQAKYKKSNDPQAKQKQQMELMALYKKEGISPMGAFVNAFVSMPVLFAMYSIVRASRALKLAVIGQISLVEQPWPQVTSGNWVYFAIIAVYLPLQVLSMMLPLFLQFYKQRKSRIRLSEQQKKSRRRQLIMQVVMLVVFVIIVATIATGVAIYWIFSSTFQIGQTLGFFIARETKAKRIRAKNEKHKMKQLKKIAAQQENN